MPEVRRSIRCLLAEQMRSAAQDLGRLERHLHDVSITLPAGGDAGIAMQHEQIQTRYLLALELQPINNSSRRSAPDDGARGVSWQPAMLDCGMQ